MKQSFEIVEKVIKDNEIDEVKIALHFYHNHFHIVYFRTEKLMASLDIDTDDDIVIHAALNAIGAGDLNKLYENVEKFHSI